MGKYRFVDQTGQRAVIANVDPHLPIKELVPNLLSPLKLPRMDVRGVELIYMLSYQARFLNSDETLASANIPENDSIDVIGLAADLGAVARNPREWADFEELRQLQAKHANIFDMQVMGRAFDGAPLSYRLTFKGIAGPVVDLRRINNQGGPPAMRPDGNPALAERFVVDIHILERYPFVEPEFFYTEAILCHPNVNPHSRMACLYQHWRPVNTLSDIVSRFISQIGYLGFDPAIFDSAAGRIHLLNPLALDWIKQYRQQSPERLPFRNSRGEYAPALNVALPAQEAPRGVVVVEEAEEITIGRV